MASNSVNTGTAGRLRIEASEVATNVAGNWSNVSWWVYLEERVTSNTTWTAGAVPAAVDVGLNGNDWTGSFSFDWRGAGNQTTLIASGTTQVVHNPDGTGSVTIRAAIGDTGTSGAGGPATVDVSLPLTTLYADTDVPFDVVATRVSDTQINLSWVHDSPSNGLPHSNQVYRSVNGGAYVQILDIAASSGATVSGQANQKLQFKVSAWNPAGFSALSDPSNEVYTTPAAPDSAAAAKNSSLDIVVSFNSNVAYSEHTHDIQHGTVSGGVTTWDAGILATVASGVESYTHVAPNSGQIHVYRVRARAGSISSGWVTTNSVQVLAAPNKPTIPAMAAFADKASPLVVAWQHNSVDTSPQTAYEFEVSTTGGGAWSSSGKVASSVSSRTIAASTYTANTELTVRVRTWGSATTGGSEGTGASPWSDPRTITFKTAPTTAITEPANGGSLDDSVIRVTLDFAQAEGASFVKAQLELLEGATLLETRESNIRTGITMGTVGQNGITYTIRARSQDSNGLWSSWASNSFTVNYLAPVPAVVTTSYLPDNGYGQLDVTIAAPGEGQSESTLVTIVRILAGVEEVIIEDYPASAALTFIDTTPTLKGENIYHVTTKTNLGAQSTVTASLVIDECRRAFLSKGAGYSDVVAFGGNLEVSSSVSVASDTVPAAGRTKPIGLYGVETNVQLKVSSYIFENFGSTPEEIEALLLQPGKACYRDPSGRRMFGSVKGSIDSNKVGRGTLSFTLIETS